MSAVQTQHATVEVTGWITKFVGGDGSGRKLFEEPIGARETVRDILRRVCARYSELDAALWDDSKKDLGDNIEVLVNDAVLGLTHTLDSELNPGDCITLVGQYMGG